MKGQFTHFETGNDRTQLPLPIDNSLLNHHQLNAQIHHKDSTMTTDFNIVHLIGIYVVLFVTLKIAGTVLFWAALLHLRQ